MRLEGLQSYGTLAALLANGCLRLYSCVNEKDAADCWYKAIAFNLFLLAVVISILSGAYTTVVFTLLPLYFAKRPWDEVTTRNFCNFGPPRTH